MKSIKKATMAGVLSLSFGLSLMAPLMAVAAGPTTLDLLSASNFVILSKTGVTNVPTSAIVGDVGTSPITGASIGLTCAEVTGSIYSVDAAGPVPCSIVDPVLLTAAVSDMETAFADAAGRTLPDATELHSGNLGGQTIAPGLYKWSTDVTIPTDVTLSGDADDIWIFQIAGNLDIASGGSVPAGIKVILSGGAQASNIFWQVDGGIGATLGTYSTFNGTILSSKQVILQTGAVLNGRALAQTQVTLDANNVSIPVPAPVVVPPVVVPPVVVSESRSGTSQARREANMLAYNLAVPAAGQVLGAVYGLNNTAQIELIRAELVVTIQKLILALQAEISLRTGGDAQSQIEAIKAQLVILIQQLIQKLQAQINAQWMMKG